MIIQAEDGWRDVFLRGAVIFGVVLWLGTELLGAFDLIRAVPLAIWWAATIVFALVWGFRSGKLFRLPRFRPVDPVVLVAVAGIAVVLVLTGITAGWSPPNSADAMAYHMPRVVYWAEQGSVRFFPTQYLNQIMLQPLAEYFMLHLYVLAGNDHFTNFVQWFGWLGSIIGVSSAARMFGANARGQAMAALFCATLPSGVLASSGAKNDCLLAFWLIAAVCFGLRFAAGCRPIDAVFLGAALGLALCTKATAYLFAPWPLLAIFLGRALPGQAFPGQAFHGQAFHGQTRNTCRNIRSRPLLAWGRGVATVGICSLVVNLPQFVRNYRLSGSALGFDSAQGDGVYRWRNETFGWKQTVSNVLRNSSEQLGRRSPRWNEGVYAAVIDLHRRLRIDPNDPATTWRWSSFHIPKNANHEADAPNAVHGAILFVVWLILAARVFRGPDPTPAIYGLALALGFLSFCAYLKWQPFLGRLFIPQFVLGAPLVGLLREPGARTDRHPRWLRGALTLAAIALSLFLLDTARHPVLDNWVRPLRGPLSVLRRGRDDRYFADMTPWNNAAAFQETVELLAHTPCGTVGVDITDFQLEYPLEALLREREPAVRFVHTGVDNASRNCPKPLAGPPCSVVCLECAGDAKRLSLYSGFRRRRTMERFVVFTQE